jgi:hypothetical protein
MASAFRCDRLRARAALDRGDVMIGDPVVRFDSRRSVAVWLTREGPAWLVLAGDYGWLHGSYEAARADAAWLSKNLGFVVRRAGNQTDVPW